MRDAYLARMDGGTVLSIKVSKDATPMVLHILVISASVDGPTMKERTARECDEI